MQMHARSDKYIIENSDIKLIFCLVPYLFLTLCDVSVTEGFL